MKIEQELKDVVIISIDKYEELVEYKNKFNEKVEQMNIQYKKDTEKNYQEFEDKINNMINKTHEIIYIAPIKDSQHFNGFHLMKIQPIIPHE